MYGLVVMLDVTTPKVHLTIQIVVQITKKDNKGKKLIGRNRERQRHKVGLGMTQNNLLETKLEYGIHTLKMYFERHFERKNCTYLTAPKLHAQSGDPFVSNKVLSTKFITITILLAMLSVWKNACGLRIVICSGKSSLNLMSLFTYLLKGCYQRLMPLQA